MQYLTEQRATSLKHLLCITTPVFDELFHSAGVYFDVVVFFFLCVCICLCFWRGRKLKCDALFVFLRAAAPQFAGEQPHAGQSGGGAGHAGVRHHQRQNQTTGRPPDQDSGRLVGVYVHSFFFDPCCPKSLFFFFRPLLNPFLVCLSKMCSLRRQHEVPLLISLFPFCKMSNQGTSAGDAGRCSLCVLYQWNYVHAFALMFVLQSHSCECNIPEILWICHERWQSHQWWNKCLNWKIEDRKSPRRVENFVSPNMFLAITEELIPSLQENCTQMAKN